jgi:hypothetical protein
MVPPFLGHATEICTLKGPSCSFSRGTKFGWRFVRLANPR